MLQTGNDRTDRLIAAEKIIREAGDRALSYFQRYKSLAVEMKSSGQDIVSIADREVEALIRSAVAEHFPDDGLLGEEHGMTPGRSPYVWVVDPIDGTSCFLHGLRSWCIAIAVLEAGVPVLGLIYDPNADELFHARIDQGAWLNGEPIRVDEASLLTEGLVAIGGNNRRPGRDTGEPVTRLLDAGGAYMRIGSSALSLAYVSCGRYLGYYEAEVHSWDCLAGLLLVREAGGHAGPFATDGGLMKPQTVFAAAPQVAEALREIVEMTPQNRKRREPTTVRPSSR